MYPVNLGKVSLHTHQNIFFAFPSGMPNFTKCSHMSLAIPTAALPAPKKTKTFLSASTPFRSRALTNPPSDTAAVPWI
jgi:hypothetical protein